MQSLDGVATDVQYAVFALLTLHHHTIIIIMSRVLQCLQCFDAVGCVAGRASGL